MSVTLGILISIFFLLEFLGTILIGTYLSIFYFDEYNEDFTSWIVGTFNKYVVDYYKQMTVFGCIIFTIGLIFVIPAVLASLLIVATRIIYVALAKFGKATMFKK